MIPQGEPAGDGQAEPVSSDSFGGFSLGAMQLALPMASLREVVPRGELIALPCPAPCVIGGIGLRGITVPVVDLRIVLGRAVEPSRFAIVVVMVHERRLLGLLADAVTGIFQADAACLTRTRVADATAAIFEAGVYRGDTGTAVSVLSPAALAALHQVPMVDDAQPRRSALEALEGGGPEADETLPVMLLRCGAVALAIDAMVVQATLSNPAIEASALARGHCRGTIVHGGLRIPAIDLQGLCGFGALDAEAGVQALTVALPQGSVALLVGEVIDIVRAQPKDISPVPAFALPQPQLFAGALPLSALPALPPRARSSSAQYLMIDAASLAACETVASLAQTNTAEVQGQGAAKPVKRALDRAVERPIDRDSSNRTGDPATPSPGRALITYLLQTEKASPLDQISEILPYPSDLSLQRSGTAVLGFIVHRGRSIPVLCLGEAIDEPAGERSARASVLVVASQGELIGFAVSALKTIAHSDWEPSLSEPAGASPAQRSRRLALVGNDEDQRMLPVLDLLQLARQLQARRQAA